MPEDPVVYRSKVNVVRVQGRTRRATLPMEAQPVYFGVHSEIATHYGADPNAEPAHAATLDYVVAAAAG